ncbi:MAG: STM3941 family protein, partial [Bacteroidota bacterium]
MGKDMEERIEISLSKLKIGLLFIGAILFVILGIQFAINSEEWVISGRGTLLFVKIIGIISIIFFGICGVSIGKKLFDQNIGPIIDDEGIIDNTNATSVGLIEWEDITGID